MNGLMHRSKLCLFDHLIGARPASPFVIHFLD
jgi:hypothetical protein